MRATLQRLDRGDVVVLKPVGRMTIDSSSDAELLKEDVDRALKQGKQLFVIDGTEVAYADSAALGEFARAYTRVKGNGGRLLFAIPLQHHLRNRFRLTKLDHEFEIYATVEEALQILTG
jgi:anti-anti-sigma factor